MNRTHMHHAALPERFWNQRPGRPRDRSIAGRQWGYSSSAASHVGERNGSVSRANFGPTCYSWPGRGRNSTP